MQWLLERDHNCEALIGCNDEPPEEDCELGERLGAGACPCLPPDTRWAQKMSNEMFFMEFMNTWYKVSQWKKLWRTEAYRDSMSGPNNDSISACCSPRLVHKLHHLVITLRKLGPGPKWSPFSRTGNFHSFDNYLHGGENMSRHPKRLFDWQIVRHRKLSENAQPCQLLSEGADITEQMQ